MTSTSADVTEQQQQEAPVPATPAVAESTTDTTGDSPKDENDEEEDDEDLFSPDEEPVTVKQEQEQEQQATPASPDGVKVEAAVHNKNGDATAPVAESQEAAATQPPPVKTEQPEPAPAQPPAPKEPPQIKSESESDSKSDEQQPEAPVLGKIPKSSTLTIPKKANRKAVAVPGLPPSPSLVNSIVPSLPKQSSPKATINPSLFGLPSGLVIPTSVKASVLHGKLLDTLKSLPLNLMNDALQEYDDAVLAKGNSIRNHGAYLFGVVKRYIVVQDRYRSGDNHGGAPMGQELTPKVNARIDKLVSDGFCSTGDVTEKVRSKIRMLNETDAISAMNELQGVDRSTIRNFSSYFMGILNRYMRGEGHTPNSSNSSSNNNNNKRKDRRGQDSGFNDRDGSNKKWRHDQHDRQNNPNKYGSDAQYLKNGLPPLGGSIGMGSQIPQQQHQQQRGTAGLQYSQAPAHSISRAPPPPPPPQLINNAIPQQNQVPGSFFNPQQQQQQQQMSRPPQMMQQQVPQVQQQGLYRPPPMQQQQQQQQQQLPSFVAPVGAPAYAVNVANSTMMSQQVPFQPQMMQQQQVSMQPPAAQMALRPPQPVGWQNQQQQQPAAMQNIPVDILGLADKAASAVQALAATRNVAPYSQQTSVLQPHNQTMNSFPNPPAQQNLVPQQQAFQQPNAMSFQPNPYQPRIQNQQQNTMMHGMHAANQNHVHNRQAGREGVNGKGGLPRKTARFEELTPNVQFALRNMQQTGQIGNHIDAGVLGMIKDLPEAICLQAIQRFSMMDKSNMRNRTAYLSGVLRREAERLHRR